MNEVTLNIDGVQVKTREGVTILEAALEAGIYIPHLCFLPEADPPIGSCRLCFVEITGRDNLVTACTETVSQGMEVHTNTSWVNRVRRTAAELIIADHHVDCKACAKNGNCELQKVAAYLKLKLKPQRFQKKERELKPIDSTHPLFIYDPNKCVLCGKCVWVCEHKANGTLDYAFRGYETQISAFAQKPLGESRCESCLACVDVCPVGALVRK